MKGNRWQFSLQQLLIVTTVVAIVLTLVSHHWRFVVALATIAGALLDAFFPIVEMVAGLLDPRTWRERKPTEREIKEFAARYPQRSNASDKVSCPGR